MYEIVMYKGKEFQIDTELKQLKDNLGRLWKYCPEFDSKIGRAESSFESDLNFVEVEGYPRGREGKKYRQFGFNGLTVGCHHLVWILHNLEIPEGIVVDHINIDPSDDRIENLRLLTNAQNLQNKSRYKVKVGKLKGQTDQVGVTIKYGKHGNKMYKANWYDKDKKLKGKVFAVNKYGEELAYFLACEVRHLEILKLNLLHGMSYSESHM